MVDYSYNFHSNTPARVNSGENNSISQNQMIPVRVIDVILDDTQQPDWDNLGKSEAIGAIRYAPLTRDTNEEDTSILPVAYPLVNDFKKLPLKNEIVFLVTAPGNQLDGSKLNVKTYYNTVVNIWNHPNHAGFPKDTSKELDLGPDIQELTDVNPLQPFPGDIIMDGRQGQSIRLGGFLSPKNILTNNTNVGKPFTILSNGQKDADDPFNPIIEDINKDASSIYLVSDHTVPLEQARDKTSSYGVPLNPRPDKADEYKGSQVLVNGGRLYFNAKDEGIFLNAKKYLELQSDFINIDAEREVSLDAELILLGKIVAEAPQSFREPVLLGHQTTIFLTKLVNSVQRIAKTMRSAKGDRGGPLPQINKRGKSEVKTLRRLKRDIKPFGTSPLKSKKVFTE